MKINNANLYIDINLGNIDESAIINDRFLHEYIPDINLIDKSFIGGTDFTLILKNSNHNFIEINENYITINYSDLCSIKDIITLIDYALEYCRQCRGIYCLHGCAVSKNNKGVIFFGQVSGLGKTSISIELVLSKKFNFLGDEKILIKTIDDKFLIKSTNKLKFNKNYLQTYLNIDENEFIKIFSINSNQWIEIDLFIQPQICPEGKLLFDKWDNFKTEYHLYEEITRKIRGCSRRVQGFSEPIQSIDTEVLSKNRSEFCKLISTKISSYHVVGDKQVVSNFIDKLI